MWRGHKDLKGEVDDRGPCGCHIHANKCQFVRFHDRPQFVEAMSKAKKEADYKFDEYLEHFFENYSAGRKFNNRNFGYLLACLPTYLPTYRPTYLPTYLPTPQSL